MKTSTMNTSPAALVTALILCTAGCHEPVSLSPGPQPPTDALETGGSPPTQRPTTQPPTRAAALPSGSTGALDARFAAAARDDGLPSLILEVSRRLETVDPRSRHALADRLEPHCKRMFFGSAQAAGMDAIGVRRHAVAENEYPYSIAGKYGIDHQLIERLNEDLDATKLQIGDRLKVLDLRDAELELEIRVTDQRLAVWRHASDQTSKRRAKVLLAYVPIDLPGDGMKLRSGLSQVTRSIRDTSAANGEGVLRIDIDAEPFDRRSLTIQRRGADPGDDVIAIDAPTLDRLLSVVRKGAKVHIVSGNR